MFRDLNLSIKKESVPNLNPTGLSNVAFFEGIVNSQDIGYSVSKIRSYAIGAALIGVGVYALLFLLITSLPILNLILFLAMFGMIIAIAIYAFSNQTTYFSGNINLDIRGESYHATADGLQGQRSSVFSRATLKTYWLRTDSFEDSATPYEFERILSEKLGSLDNRITSILPKFELEKLEIPDTKT